MTQQGHQLDAAAQELAAAIAETGAFVRSHPFAGEGQRGAGYMFWLSMLLARLEDHVLFDPDFPYFRVVDPRTREGGDNADQRYLATRLNGGDTYRVWGTIGAARRLEVQIYAGVPFDLESPGRMASYLTFEELDVAPDGSFEVIIGPDRRPGNWLENPPDATDMLVRQVYSEWGVTQGPGEVHIDRVGHEGDVKPVLADDALAWRMRAAADDLRRRVRLWPELVQQAYLGMAPPNTISALMDPGELGGVPGRWMAHGTFDLADDEALVITTGHAGHYQGIQLCNLWFSSLEYANRQTSLSGDQAHLGSDGSYRFVVAGCDPGVANWLDTAGHRSGIILLRFDGTGGTPIDDERQPSAQLVHLDDLDEHLPTDTPRCTPGDRGRQLAARRRHVQRRFGF